MANMSDGLAALNSYGLNGVMAQNQAQAQYASQAGAPREPLLVDRLAEANGRIANFADRLNNMLERLSGPTPTNLAAAQTVGSNATPSAPTLVREVNRLASQQGDLETVISRLEALI